MAKTLSNIRIYGDEASLVAVGPKGTTLPVDLAALPAGFDEAGWLSDAGVDIMRKMSVKKFNAFQGGTFVRQKRTSDGDSFKFICLEETATTLGLFYPGATITTATGVTTVDVKAAVNVDERAWVVDLFDGDVQKRYAVARGEVGDIGTISHKNTDLTMYEFTVNIIGDFTIITNSPAFP